MASQNHPPLLPPSISFRKLEERFRASIHDAGALFEQTNSLPAALAFDEGGDLTQTALGSTDLQDSLQPTAEEGAATPAVAKKKPKFSPAARRRMFHDKLVFTVGLTNICLTSLWLGTSPQTFYIKFIATMSTLFTLRFIIYRPKGHHYYMAEYAQHALVARCVHHHLHHRRYCYWGNIQLALYFVLAPSNALLRKVCTPQFTTPTSHTRTFVMQVVFAQMTGPITWSIILQRNSMVLHSLDKVCFPQQAEDNAWQAWVPYAIPHSDDISGYAPEPRLGCLVHAVDATAAMATCIRHSSSRGMGQGQRAAAVPAADAALHAVVCVVLQCGAWRA